MSFPVACSQPCSVTYAFVNSSLCTSSVVVASTEYLLASRSEHEAMFQLSRITTFDIAKRWISFHDARFDQVVQAEEIFVLAKAVQISPAEWQGTKVFVDDIEQCASAGHSKSHLRSISSFGVVGTFQLEHSVSARGVEVVEGLTSSFT